MADENPLPLSSLPDQGGCVFSPEKVSQVLVIADRVSRRTGTGLGVGCGMKEVWKEELGSCRNASGDKPLRLPVLCPAEEAQCWAGGPRGSRCGRHEQGAHWLVQGQVT